MGGFFTNVGPAVRNRVAAVDVATGAVTTFDPNANGNVNSLAVAGATVYVGGNFTTVAGIGGLATAWPRSTPVTARSWRASIRTSTAS